MCSRMCRSQFGLGRTLQHASISVGSHLQNWPNHCRRTCCWQNRPNHFHPNASSRKHSHVTCTCPYACSCTRSRPRSSCSFNAGNPANDQHPTGPTGKTCTDNCGATSSSSEHPVGAHQRKLAVREPRRYKDGSAQQRSVDQDSRKVGLLRGTVL